MKKEGKEGLDVEKEKERKKKEKDGNEKLRKIA